MHNPTTKPDTCPVATPGCACLPPRQAHSPSEYTGTYGYGSNFFCDVTTAHMRPPRPALPSFRAELALYRGL